jgi:hypothetical protein
MQVTVICRGAARVMMVWVALACQQCASDTTPPGAMSNAGASGSGAVTNMTAPAATFTQVYEMLFPRVTNAHCDMCHGLPPYDLSNGNLTTGTDKATTYAALVGKSSTSSMCKGRVLVAPSHPENSLLLQKLEPNPPCGLRMPNGGATLTDTQIELVRSWIAAGAQDD